MHSVKSNKHRLDTQKYYELFKQKLQQDKLSSRLKLQLMSWLNRTPTNKKPASNKTKDCTFESSLNKFMHDEVRRKRQSGEL